MPSHTRRELKCITCMREFIFVSMVLLMNSMLHAQRVGIGNTTPATKLDVTGTAAGPTIPGAMSTGIIRIGVGALEGVDIGKMVAFPYSGWIQSGYNSSESDPLSFQPSGGNVGIGTTSPVRKLSVEGSANFTGNVSIGIIGPEISAALEVNSSSQGFLPPRMTSTARNGIASPVAGLVIWCTNCGLSGELQVHNGSSWTNMIGMPSAPAIGDVYGGGIVAYLLQPGDPGYIAGQLHGLIATPVDQSPGSAWGCAGVGIQGGDGIVLGTGNQNTIDIVNGCAEVGHAAKKCSDLVLGGFNDWYLPSKDELNKLYLNREAIGGFSTGNYWSSSEFSNSDAWDQMFNASGFQCNGHKDILNHVRAVRSF